MFFLQNKMTCKSLLSISLINATSPDGKSDVQIKIIGTSPPHILRITLAATSLGGNEPFIFMKTATLL